MKTLKIDEMNFLLDQVGMPSYLRKRLIGKKKKDHQIELSDDEAYLLHELCGRQLQIDGFDDNDQPTEKGRKLENLIDKL